MKRKKNSILVIIIILLLAGIAAASMYFFNYAERRAEAMEAERIAEEKQKEEEAGKQALAGKIDEEKSKWYLILVNSDNAIPDDFEIETSEIEDGYSVDTRVKEPLQEMLADCRAAGFSPKIISAFRTRAFQQKLYDSTANKADTAIPGHSEHECGLAADIVDAGSLSWGDPLIDKQEEMPAQKWLMEHCHEYGFILRYPRDKEDITKIIYEPWHYRYVGREHASKIMENNICLEEYIKDMDKYYDPE